MGNLSFFAGTHLLGSIIRGKQIAEYLKVPLNPQTDYENKVCIYVKPKTLDRVRDGDWVDVSDGSWLVNALESRPGINVIAHSQYCYEFLKSRLSNTVVWISQQHINWENEERRSWVQGLVGGYIGRPSPQATQMYQEVGDALKKAGLDFITCFDYKMREDAIRFYQMIDFLVVGPWKDMGPYKTPAKLINAASFGVPSIAYPLPGYQEWEGNYFRANDLPEIIEIAKTLNGLWTDNLTEAASSYHISRVADRYRALT